MKRILSLIILLVAVALVASASCLLTRHYFGHPAAMTAAKPEIFEQLGLSAEQEQKINAIRAQFNASQHQCMLLMQQRNRELAGVILAERADSPRVQAAVEKIHEVMGDMQKTTLTSIFAARDILTPAQYDHLLKLVATQLSTGTDNACCQ